LILPLVATDMTSLLVEKASKCLPLVETTLLDLCTKVQRATRTSDSDDYYDIRAGIEFVESTIARYNSVHALFSKQNLLNSVVESDGDARASISVVEPAELREFLLELLGQPPASSCPAVPPSSSMSSHLAVTRRLRILDAPRGPLASIIRSCMVDNDTNSEKEGYYESLQMPEPTRKQYILRWLVPSPGMESRVMPQRMYTSVSKDEFRLCGAFTTDTTFI